MLTEIAVSEKQTIKFLSFKKIKPILEDKMAVPKVITEECTGCEECIEACPAEAITMKDSIAVISAEACTECGACVDECPVEAIVE